MFLANKETLSTADYECTIFSVIEIERSTNLLASFIDIPLKKEKKRIWEYECMLKNSVCSIGILANLFLILNE